MAWEKSVFSSNVQSIGYDDETGELLVTWNTGRVSAYAGVSEDLAVELSHAPSVGGMLNSTIKNQYPHRYVR